MNIYNELEEIDLVFVLSYEELKEDIEITKNLLLEKLSPLAPTAVHVSKMGRSYCRLRFLSNVTRLDNILDTIMNTLLKNYSYIQALGVGFSLWDFLIYIKYCISLSVCIKSEQLTLLKEFHTVFARDVESTSISTNSSQISNKNTGVDYYDFKMSAENDNGEYYQLFFYFHCTDEMKQSIINAWNIYYAKYSSCQHWGYDKNTTFTNSPYIVLSIKTYVEEQRELNEIQNDLFSFIEFHKQFIKNHVNKIAFGVYNCNYDGGEIGSSIILPLIDLKISLLITRSIMPPADAYNSVNL